MPPRKCASIRAAFGGNVRARRLRQGLTQHQFARKAGVHRTYLADIEGGKRNPCLTIICQLSHASKVSMSVLMSGL
jgi:transcriptional regulator with XRE-family HTH domain